MGLFENLFKKAAKLIDAEQEQSAVSTANREEPQQYRNEQIPKGFAQNKPVPFGYNSAWLAVYGCTPQQVIEGLHLKNAAVSTWNNGIEASEDYKSGKVFVSPVINNYVLVINADEIVIDEDRLKKSAEIFGNMCAFATNHVSEYHFWAKFEDGKLIRAYRFVGDVGEVELNVGELTPEEQQLGFDNLIKHSDDDWEKFTLPDESNVLDIAKAWSVDTTFADFYEELGTGYLCEI